MDPNAPAPVVLDGKVVLGTPASDMLVEPANEDIFAITSPSGPDDLPTIGDDLDQLRQTDGLPMASDAAAPADETDRLEKLAAELEAAGEGSIDDLFLTAPTDTIDPVAAPEPEVVIADTMASFAQLDDVAVLKASLDTMAGGMETFCAEIVERGEAIVRLQNELIAAKTQAERAEQLAPRTKSPSRLSASMKRSTSPKA